MTEQVAKIAASLVAWFAAHKIDQIIGRYLAALQIAFDRAASQAAREVYAKSYAQIALNLASKSDEWAKWRDGTKNHSLPANPSDHK